MNLGIIIVFNNDAHIINVDYIVKILNANNFKICLVNNASKDNTSSILNRIKFESNTNSDVFVLDNKQDRGLKYAVKAGARFLLNETEFNSIIYLESNILMYLKNMADYFFQLTTQKEKYKACPTRSDRNVLKDVFPLAELLKMNNRFN
ncbi:glycosyltransferase [Polaribacter litorisediminis]|uniref:glycosyltransferase n=1 Tax=Polaribacter litorisediminis TaxID=1908341 RepID=UPI001CC08B2B|nr:glycosyltransferase [Polaribacter litorisediminis]UAM99338.1 glycosyltransferase [Polaribacter litorisediminis]